MVGMCSKNEYDDLPNKA